MKEQATEGNLNFVTRKTWRQTRSERAPLNWLGTRAKREVNENYLKAKAYIIFQNLS